MLPSKTYHALLLEVEKVYRQLPDLNKMTMENKGDADEHLKLLRILNTIQKLELKAVRLEKKSKLGRAR